MDGQSENMQVDLSEALAQDGQLIITNEDGNGKNTKKYCENFHNILLIFIITHSIPSWHQWNDNTSSHSSDVSFARPTTNAKQ